MSSELGRFFDPTFVKKTYADSTNIPLQFDPLLTPVSQREFASQLQEGQRPGGGEGIASWIRYFDTNSGRKKEGLPRDWYNLRTQSAKRVGFIMSRQMDLLKNPDDRSSLLDWTKKTKRDLEGFKLEFLSNEIVYPRKYEIKQSEKDGSQRLVEPQYGKAKGSEAEFVDIVDLISEQERKGSVKRAVARAKDFLLSAPDRSIAVITSPLGPTGFKTDDGLAIDYPDSYFFIMQKQGETVMNYTLKTNFKLKECRDVIEKLEGTTLRKEEALVQDYVDAVALLKPGDKGIQSVHDIVALLRNIQPARAFVDEQNAYITTWDEVSTAIDRGETLYTFEEKTMQVITHFTDYTKEGGHTKEELQKAIAVTILRMADIFFEPKSLFGAETELKPNVWSKPLGIEQRSFGSILEKTAERRGCSGGGISQAVDSLTTRLGSLGSDNFGSRTFNCPECGKENTRPKDELLSECQHCKSKAVAC